MADNILSIDPNETLLRVRTVMEARPLSDESDFVLDLTKTQLIDMVFCACSLLQALRVALPAGFIEEAFKQGVEF